MRSEGRVVDEVDDFYPSDGVDDADGGLTRLMKAKGPGDPYLLTLSLDDQSVREFDVVRHDGEDCRECRLPTTLWTIDGLSESGLTYVMKSMSFLPIL